MLLCVNVRRNSCRDYSSAARHTHGRSAQILRRTEHHRRTGGRKQAQQPAYIHSVETRGFVFRSYTAEKGRN